MRNNAIYRIVLTVMTIKQKILSISFSVLVVAFVVSLIPAAAYAASCGGADTTLINCSQDNSGGVETNGIWGLLLLVLQILTAGVGVVAVGGIVYAAILYASAEDKSDQVNQAKMIITNIVIGLIAFALMWAGINFLIPGGVFT